MRQLLAPLFKHPTMAKFIAACSQSPAAIPLLEGKLISESAAAGEAIRTLCAHTGRQNRGQ
ncbi:hypothetical protein ACSSV1_003147 [Labrenzia sp. MBR-25]